MSKEWLKVAFPLLLISACAGNSTSRILEGPESMFDTGGETPVLFHSAIYYPAEISLKFSGFLVGVEKSPVDRISDRTTIHIHGRPQSGLSEEKARSRLIDRKLLFVSHVIEDMSGDYGRSNCFLYNAYNQPGYDITGLAKFCNGYERVTAPQNAYQQSWKALAILQERLKERINTGNYTHIVVITMGWNTVQEKAVRNFNSIGKSINVAAGDTFRPLFVGVTWPSQWESDWLEPIYKGISFPVKADDADELGLTWLGVLLHSTIPAANQDRLPVVVIGHSFGSRASSMAACVGPVISPDGILIPLKADSRMHLINLQGAFLIHRLLGEADDRGIAFTDRCRNVGHIWLTASKYDTAMDHAFWGYYAGNESSYTAYCTANSDINCDVACEDGSLHPGKNPHPGSHITYVNASSLIRYAVYESGGGAHSDIYRNEHGRMIWEMISK